MMYLVVYPGLVFEPWLQEHEDYRAQQAELEKRALQIRVSARQSVFAFFFLSKEAKFLFFFSWTP